MTTKTILFHHLCSAIGQASIHAVIRSGRLILPRRAGVARYLAKMANSLNELRDEYDAFLRDDVSIDIVHRSCGYPFKVQVDSNLFVLFDGACHRHPSLYVRSDSTL